MQRMTIGHAFLYSASAAIFAVLVVLFVLWTVGLSDPLWRAHFVESIATAKFWSTAGVICFIAFTTALELMLMLWWKER